MWLVSCFGFYGPLRQSFSLYRVVSQRGRRNRENIDERKNVRTIPTRIYCKRNRPFSYYYLKLVWRPGTESLPSTIAPPDSRLDFGDALSHSLSLSLSLSENNKNFGFTLVPWRFSKTTLWQTWKTNKLKRKMKERKEKWKKGKRREKRHIRFSLFTEEIADHIASTLKRGCSNARGISKNC